MASESVPLLAGSNISGSRGLDYRTFMGGNISFMAGTISTAYTSRSAWSRPRKLTAGNSLTYFQFNKNQPENISTCQLSSASFDNPAFAALQGPPLCQLDWLTLPTTVAIETKPLCPFSVQANPQVVEDVRLTVHACQDGLAQVTGQTRVSFRSQGPDRPSVAVFRDVIIKRAGTYVLEVRSVGHPQFSLLATLPLTVGANYRQNGSSALHEEMGHRVHLPGM